MSITTFVLGDSGTGKSTSLRNLDPKTSFLIQIRQKPLPFKSKEWCQREKREDDTWTDGNIFVSDNSDKIVRILRRLPDHVKTIIIDDFQYLMSNEFMRSVTDELQGNAVFHKYNCLAKNAYEVIDAATSCPTDKRIYIMAHTQTDEMGRTSIKTIGKLLDEKIVLEGMVTIVLRTQVINGNYLFSTHNNGNDTVKTPIDMFERDLIGNDLNEVDTVICDYYGIEKGSNNV
ncbi:AAA family ATPase [Snodgrassella alvi]|uniref:ATP-binding protein n=1 Tax=Snodgrassella alvi TaxID=1196083 RepID=A0A2N9XY98_9NEIS|nr:AAA family ATPase [Snodgrassella alvi]PIT55401.1 ATP-binding protein [Snodgrassella alvi]